MDRSRYYFALFLVISRDSISIGCDQGDEYVMDRNVALSSIRSKMELMKNDRVAYTEEMRSWFIAAVVKRVG